MPEEKYIWYKDHLSVDEWSEGVEYNEGDRVVYEDTRYVCLEPHESSDTNKPGIDPDSWSSGVAFYEGDIVKHNNEYYECTGLHLSSNDNEPGVGDNWEDHWTSIDLEIPWAPEKREEREKAQHDILSIDTDLFQETIRYPEDVDNVLSAIDSLYNEIGAIDQFTRTNLRDQFAVIGDFVADDTLRDKLDKIHPYYAEDIPEWESGQNYEEGDRVISNDTRYKCTKDHESSEDNKPREDDAPWEEDEHYSILEAVYKMHTMLTGDPDDPKDYTQKLKPIGSFTLDEGEEEKEVDAVMDGVHLYSDKIYLVDEDGIRWNEGGDSCFWVEEINEDTVRLRFEMTMPYSLNFNIYKDLDAA